MTREETILSFLPYVEGISGSMCHFSGVYDPFLREDCCSFVIEAMILAIDNYCPDCGAALKTWVTKKSYWAAKQFLRDLFGREDRGTVRRKIRDTNCSSHLSLDEIGDHSDCSINDEESICNIDMVENLLRFLRPSKSKKDRRGVLYQYFFEGFTMQEIADMEGCSGAKISLMISGIKSDISNSRLKKEYQC